MIMWQWNMLVVIMNTAYQIHLYLNVKVHMPDMFNFQRNKKKANENAKKSKKKTLMLDEISEVKKKKRNIEECIVSHWLQSCKLNK